LLDPRASHCPRGAHAFIDTSDSSGQDFGMPIDFRARRRGLMTRPGMRPLALRTILSAVDPDDPAMPSLRAAARLADAAGASLRIVAVGGRASSSGAEAPWRTGLAKALDATSLQLDDVGIHAHDGDPAIVIGSVADSVSADCIVLGPHRGARSQTPGLGGTALGVVTNASCPCLVVTRDLSLPLNRVLVPVDLSDTARGALLVGLSWASALRARDGSEVTLGALHVMAAPLRGSAPTPPAIERELAAVRDAAGGWAGVTVDAETIAEPDIAQGIARYVADRAPDLVVMGTRGLGLEAVGRLGSVAASVVAGHDVTTLLVPPAVWMAHGGTREVAR
jgi:nucleotide-binding universal stress UspA family protein